MKTSKVERLTKMYMNQEGMTQRKLKNRMKTEQILEDTERGQKPVKEMTITVEWKKSQTWGNCPKAKAEIRFQDGTYTNIETRTVTGCGYDKESTAVAEIFNQTLKYQLWNREDLDNSKAPYGVRLNYDFSPYFEGGVGVECYYNIARFIGGEFARIATGKTFDVYKFSMEGIA